MGSDAHALYRQLELTVLYDDMHSLHGVCFDHENDVLYII
jgi:hypothetical protein